MLLLYIAHHGVGGSYTVDRKNVQLYPILFTLFCTSRSKNEYSRLHGEFTKFTSVP